MTRTKVRDMTEADDNLHTKGFLEYGNFSLFVIARLASLGDRKMQGKLKQDRQVCVVSVSPALEIGPNLTRLHFLFCRRIIIPTLYCLGGGAPRFISTRHLSLSLPPSLPYSVSRQWGSNSK